MEDRQKPENRINKGESFFIEAAIDERGPQQLKIQPSYHQYLVYNDEGNMCACIQLNDDGEWEQIDGEFTNGVVQVIGQAIKNSR